MMSAGPTRRDLWRSGFLAAAAVLSRPTPARANPPAASPESAVMLVPGPEDGATARWATRARAGLSRGLTQAAALHLSLLGGPDGVTAANRFASVAAPDGKALLLLPGLAAQAHLVGETRARFEPRHWPPICCVLREVVVAGRGSLPAASRTANRPIRLALSAPDRPETMALLALDLLGRGAAPIFGLSGRAAKAALQQGAADALVMTGPHATEQMDALGLTPWFTADPLPGRGPSRLAEVPTVLDLAPATTNRVLIEAWRASSATLRCPHALVLPALTPADIVALWRGAARRWVEAEPETEAGRQVAESEATAAFSDLCPPAGVALVYREWLMRRLGWRAA